MILSGIAVGIWINKMCRIRRSLLSNFQPLIGVWPRRFFCIITLTRVHRH